MISFGENLKYLRLKKGYTQEELANELNISHQSVSKWETNTSLANVSYCVPLAKALDCTLNDLFQVKDIS